VKHRLLFVALSLIAATSVAGSPASANVQSDGQPYGYVHMPSYPLLKGCWYYPFTFDVYLPDGTYQWTGSTQATDAEGQQRGDIIVFTNGVSAGEGSTQFCSGESVLGTHTLAGGNISASYNTSEGIGASQGEFLGDEFDFFRALSAVTLDAPARARVNRKTRVSIGALQGADDFAVDYQRAPVRLEQRLDGRWRPLDFEGRTSSRGVRSFNLYFPSPGRYTLRAVLDDDGPTLPEGSQSSAVTVRVR
jgi:hypothetical protein